MQYRESTPVQQRSSGTKAIALDQRATLARYRLLQLLALLISAGFGLTLHIVFGH
jgi:hypothetical protein